jgi:hypothetical protein
VLNIWLVWPHFNDWGKFKAKMAEAQKKLDNYQAEVNRTSQYQGQLNSLVADETTVMPEDQAINLQRNIDNQAVQSGVQITSGSTRANIKTNESFVEHTRTISVQSGERQLVDFLYNLSSGSSMIRVRELNLRPDASRMALGGNITLVASYQRKAVATPATTAAVTTKPAEKRAAPAEKQPPAGSRVSATNQPRTSPERRSKPADKPANPPNKRS